MHRKYLEGAVVADNALGPRQVRVVANSGQPDRAGDVLVASGCKLDRYRANPIVLADHSLERPIGTAKIYVVGQRLEALVTFAPPGISAKADEYCGLAKAGVLGTVSVGFRSIDREPIKETGGDRFNQWKLLELSFVAVPCDPGALVIQRGYEKSGRVLSGENAAALAGAIKCLQKSSEAHQDAVELLDEADRHRARAVRHANRIAQNAQRPPDDSVDVELALAAERRQREIEILELNAPPADAEAARRQREIEILELNAPPKDSEEERRQRMIEIASLRAG